MQVMFRLLYSSYHGVHDDYREIVKFDMITITATSVWSTANWVCWKLQNLVNYPKLVVILRVLQWVQRSHPLVTDRDQLLRLLYCSSQS